MLETVLLVAGLVVGAAAGWLLAAARQRAAASAVEDLRVRAARAEATAVELRRQAEALTTEAAQLRDALKREQVARATAQTRLEEADKHLLEQRRLLEDAEKRLKDTFAALSAEALRQNADAFARQAEERVLPLKEALTRYEAHLAELEKNRAGAYSALETQIRAMGETSQNLQKETARLVTALRAPQVRGRWGEVTLRRIVELAGMSAHCDFSEQVSTPGESGRLRPDLIVHLPGGRTIVVDAKTPLNDCLDALAADNEADRQAAMARHARAVRAQLDGLSGRDYWRQFEQTPDFVVMFLPGESFFSAALEQDRDLIEYGVSKRVLLATPTTLIALLKTVAHAWQQRDIAENAERIAAAGRELFERVAKFAEHLDNMARHLDQAVRAFNGAAGSWQSRVLPSGRKLVELGATPRDAELPELRTVEGPAARAPSATQATP